MQRHSVEAPPIDWEDQSAEVSVVNNATDTTILDFRVKFGKVFKITGFGQAWDAPMNTFVAYTLLIDGVPHPKYINKTVQITPPEQVGYNEVPVPIEVPQAARIQVIANMAAGGTTGNFTARVKGGYYDP